MSEVNIKSMDAKNLKVGFNTLISLVFTIVSIAGLWFTVKGDVSIHEIHIVNLEAKVAKLEAEAIKHRDASEVKHRKHDIDLAKIIAQMHTDKVEIITAIHEHRHR